MLKGRISVSSPSLTIFVRMIKRTYLLLPLIIVGSVLLFSFLHNKELSKNIEHEGCCLSQGTLVEMSNGKVKLIELLQAGDTVLAFDRNTNKYVRSRVLKTFQTEHAGFVKLKFGSLFRNGIQIFDTLSIIVSADHPIWIKDKGWCSSEPEMTKRILMLKEVKKIKVGDFCYTNKDLSMEGFSGDAKLVSIEKVKENVQAYTIVQLENKMDCFVANGIVVGTEAMSMESGGE